MVNSKVPQVLPPGTTHFCPAFGRYPNRAMKLKGCDEWAYWTGFDWFDGCRPPPSVRREMIDVRPKVTGPSIAELIEQGYLATLPFKCKVAPVTAVWNGPEDGLPPVGLEVERRFPCVAGSSWLPGTVIAKGAKKVFFRDAVGDEWAHCIEDVEFRPARTAEQLAAEEHRAKYMPRLIKLWDADTQRTDFLEAVYALIVEAGKP